jgi:hypothetical protein
MRRSNDDDDEQDEDDWEDDDGVDGDDDEPTVPCPYCRREMLEDSPRCPFCERYISAEDSPGPRRPLWLLLTALACLGMAVWWVFAGF